jgi:hypothetical protein
MGIIPGSAHPTDWTHDQHAFFRRIFTRRDGTEDFHIIRRCLSCGVNTLGAGRWVARKAVKDAEKLPLDPYSTTTSQPTGLFDGLEGGGQS